jgi:hypothetical protein
MSPSRSLLLTIERIYINILRVEEADFRDTLRGREEGFSLTRAQSLESAFRILNWVGMDAVAKYNKGKVLLARMLSVTCGDNSAIYKYIVVHMSDWFTAKDEIKQARVIYESVRKVIMMGDATDMIKMMCLLPYSSAFRKMLKSRIGVAYLMSMLHHVEELFDQLINYDFSTTETLRPSNSYVHMISSQDEFLDCIARFIIYLYLDRTTFPPLEVFPSIKILVSRVKEHIPQMLIVEKDGHTLLESRYNWFIQEGATIYKER